MNRYVMFLAAMLWVPAIPLLAAEPASGGGAAAEIRSDVAVLMHRGTIDVLDLEENRLLVSGMSFEVPLETTVNIRGTTGAFSLLQEGMQAEVTYYEYPDRRVAIDITQLPDNVAIEQS